MSKEKYAEPMIADENGNLYVSMKYVQEKYKPLEQENKELKEKIEALKELDLYTCEADYDYEENLELNYVPFSMEEFLEEISNI